MSQAGVRITAQITLSAPTLVLAHTIFSKDKSQNEGAKSQFELYILAGETTCPKITPLTTLVLDPGCFRAIPSRSTQAS